MSALTSASTGHLDAVDHALVARADAVRARDRAVVAVVARALRWLVVLALGAGCYVVVFAPTCLYKLDCRGNQREAKSHLKALYVAEESYRNEYDRYSDDAAQLGFVARSGGVPRYRVLVRLIDDTHYLAYAVGESGLVRGDVWRVDENVNLTNVRNACDR